MTCRVSVVIQQIRNNTNPMEGDGRSEAYVRKCTDIPVEYWQDLTPKLKRYNNAYVFLRECFPYVFIRKYFLRPKILVPFEFRGPP